MILRPETSDDIEAIFDLTQAAFATMPYSDGSEGSIINRLRQDGDLILSLVAEIDGQIVGQISFSPISLGDESAGLYGLGPVSAHPDRQKQGIGSALIAEGIAQLTDAKAIFLIGDPNYYGRFGFTGDCGLSYGDVPAEYVQGLSLDGKSRVGALCYAPAFDTN